MTPFIEKWSGPVIVFLTISFLGGVITFIQMGSAVAENTKDIEGIRVKTDIVTELRVKQENLIDSVKDNTKLIRANAGVLQQILLEVRK